jgi:hypothetical protein
VESAKRNVASGKAKYAIYDEATKKLYILACTTPASAVPTFEDQRCVEQYLGQRLKITGIPQSGTAPIARVHSARI